MNFVAAFGAALLMARLGGARWTLRLTPCGADLWKVYLAGLLSDCLSDIAHQLDRSIRGYSFSSLSLHGMGGGPLGPVWFTHSSLLDSRKNSCSGPIRNIRWHRGSEFWPQLYFFPFCSAPCIFGTLARVFWEPRASSATGRFRFHSAKDRQSLAGCRRHASFDFGETFLYSVRIGGIVLQGHLPTRPCTRHMAHGRHGGAGGQRLQLSDYGILALAIHFLFPAKHAEPHKNKRTIVASSGGRAPADPCAFA